LTELVQQLTMRQQTVLSPRLQQSVRILQMSAFEFAQELQQALSSNPFLEEAEPEAADDEGAIAAHGASQPSVDAAPAAPIPREYSGDYPVAAGRRADAYGASADVGAWAEQPVTLAERLRADLCGYRLGPRDRVLAEFIIDALDDDGYLRQDLATLAGEAAFDPPPADREWNVALKLVQQLDGSGIGARNLAECLTLQLNAADCAPGLRRMAIDIVNGHLEKLARCDYAGLRRLVGGTEAELRAACALIRTLDPKPGRRHAGKGADYVVPDVIVRKENGKWTVVPNRSFLPRARLHQEYAALFQRARGGDRSPMAQELQEARWLIQNIEQRFQTIQRVAEAIVARQRTFFEYGEIALRPLMLREVADELSIHESTVSRATGNKYMATPRGVFEFRHFFSRELGTETGGVCSAAAVRALMEEFIAQENPASPLSDVALAHMLGDQGLKVARRTVSKYRLQMRVPPAELRRRA
jgi:RNA polymerase sigma-54 factor